MRRFIIIVLLAFATVFYSCKKDAEIPVVSYAPQDVNAEAGPTTCIITCKNEAVDGISIRIRVLVDKDKNFSSATQHDMTASGDKWRCDVFGLTQVTKYYYRFELFSDVDTYRLKDVYDFTTTTAQQTNYTIGVSASPSNAGTVSGGGTYQQGQSCRVSATAATDYTFVRWTENGNQVSTNASYTFTVNGNRSLVAIFTPNNNFTIAVSASPTNGGTVSGGGTYQMGQSCTVRAVPYNGYSFSKWTEYGVNVSSNANYTFTVNGYRVLVANFVYNGGGGSHEYVDLGLPSGTLWATCNIGASTPEDYGNCYAWGETQPKSVYDWSNYRYCMGSSNTLTKYCQNSSFGYEGYTDNLTILQSGDDAATVNWGTGWRTPKKDEWMELYSHTTITWTTQNGVSGRLFTATNGNSIFLPAARSVGRYWSSSLATNSNPPYAWYFGFDVNQLMYNTGHRSIGYSVRAVRSH